MIEKIKKFFGGITVIEQEWEKDAREYAEMSEEDKMWHNLKKSYGRKVYQVDINDLSVMERTRLLKEIKNRIRDELSDE